MGFLMMGFRHIGLFVIIVLLIAGCAILKLPSAPRVQSRDWNMYGGEIGRTNVAKEILIPPLTVAWEYDASAGFSPYSAAAVDTFLFVGNLKGEVQVIKIKNGKGAGDRDFGSAILGTPVIDDEMMYVVLAHDEESMQAYNLQSAVLQWRAHVGDVETSPLLLNRKLYVTTLEGKLHCIDKSYGTLVWTYELPRNVRTPIIRSSPSSDGNIIVFGSDHGNVYAVGASDGMLRWTARTRASIVATPSVSNGTVFVGSLDSTMYALDIATGAIRWTQPLGARIFASQAVDQQHVYVGTVGRTMYCLDAATGKIIWNMPTNGIINSAPLISGNIVYVGCADKNLYAFNKETGEAVWQYTAEGRIKTMPIIISDRLILLTEDRSVIGMKQKVTP
jgi:outer membrane protein assembly factor BamB